MWKFSLVVGLLEGRFTSTLYLDVMLIFILINNYILLCMLRNCCLKLYQIKMYAGVDETISLGMPKAPLCINTNLCLQICKLWFLSTKRSF
jgi:hypothetical protein